VPHHYRLVAGEESLTCEDAGRCPPAHRGGRVAQRALGNYVFYHGADVRALT
jgi:hypothetical protein